MVASSHSGSCQCGAVSLALDMKPFLAYNCHCSHCRAFASRFQPPNNKPVSFHGGAAVWKWNVALNGEQNIEYERSSALGGLFAMSRGRCSKCHQTIWESGEMAIAPFAMVMTEPLLQIKPDVDIFYNSGFQEGPTGSKVLYSDLGSLVYEIFVILFGAVPLILPWSIVKRTGRKKNPFQKED